MKSRLQLLNSGIAIVLFIMMPMLGHGQDHRFIDGIVKNTQNEPLAGVSVQLQNTATGVISDTAGKFRILLPNNVVNTLLFSSAGMESREVEVLPTENSLNVVLSYQATNNDEVVVVGAYGTKQKRADLVGSAFQVNSERIKDLPPSRIDALLEGLVPGLQVAPNTDDASSTKQRLTLRIRGEGSMSASNEPLWIVDGTPIFTGDRTNMIPGIGTSISPLTYINPEDIESITVLKDAAATSIYGANGANGVILVNTKKGKIGRPSVSLFLRGGIAKINEGTRFKVLNGEQYMELAKEAFINAGKDPQYFPFQDNELNSYSNTNTNWTDVFYDRGWTTDANLSVSGGKDRTRYYVSGGYFNNKSTLIGNTQNRIALRTAIDMQLSEKFNLSIVSALSSNKNNVFIPGNDYYQFLPIYSPYNPDGSFRLYNMSIDGADAAGNPNWVRTRFLNSVAEREENDNIQRTMVGNANITLAYKILNGLDFTSQVGTDYQTVNEERYDARTNWSGISSDGPRGYAARNNFTSLYWTVIERLNYNRTFGKHTVGALAGIELGSRDSKTLGATGSGFINDKIKEVTYATDRQGSSSRSTTRTVSYLGQLSYSYDSRYYFVTNARRDGSSGFGSDARWGDFGSIGASWNIHNEEFFYSDKINVLKLKASFGSNGNSRLGSQEALGLYSYGESNNYAGELGAVMSGSPNPGLSWETAYTTNLGLRIKLFNRLDIDLEGYHKKTINLLSNLDVSRTTGDTRSYRNSGEVLNQGIEATINYIAIDKPDLTWWVELNAAANKNKLVELYNGIEKVMGNYIWREGYPLNTFYVIRWAGVDPRDGMPLWYDANNNLTRIYSDNNRVPWETSDPTVFGGLTTSTTYKNVTLRALFTYVLGGYSFSSFGRNVMSDGLNIMSQNQSVNQLDRWQNPGDVVSSTKPIWGISTRSVMSSTRHIFRTTNVRLKNISLGYRLPQRFAKKAGFENAGITLIGDNIFVWTPRDKTNKNSSKVVTENGNSYVSPVIMNTYAQSIVGYPMERAFSLVLSLNF